MTTGSETPLKILILVRRFPNVVQTYILNHIISLKNRGASPLIIAENSPQQSDIHPDIEKYNLLDNTLYLGGGFLELSKQFFIPPFISRCWLHAFRKISLSNVWWNHGIKYGIKSIMRAKSIYSKDLDVIHSHSLFSSYNFLFLKEYLSIPLVTTFHGMVPKGVNELNDNSLKLIFHNGDIFLVNTEYAKRKLVKLGCMPEKIRIIPQGTNLDNFPFTKRAINPDEKIILMSVGRLSHEKGHHIALKALIDLVDEHPNLEYHLVGDGDEKEHLIQLAALYGLEDKIIFHGFKISTELQTLYAQAHIFLLPSINETQGVVIQEAQASGIPVIGSNAGGVAEVINDGETGFLYDVINQTDLTSKVNALINDPSLYEKLCRAGRSDVEARFDINVISKQLISIYSDLVRH